MDSESIKKHEDKERSIQVSNPLVPVGSYLNGLQISLGKLFPFLIERDKKDILQNKLMLEQDVVDKGKYIQFASEITICSWFAHVASNIKERFEYEYTIERPKNVDCVIWHKGYQFNIEVKCANYDKQKNIVADSDFVVHGLGRLDDYGSLVSRLKNLFGTSSEQSILGAAHHMDCKMKEYLNSAQAKFGGKVLLDNLNILFVCVDDQMDMTKWISYLNGPYGLFTNESFEPRENYNNVDLVVFTNLYHRHADLESKSNISDHWDLSKAFNFAVVNPGSVRKDELVSVLANLLPLENVDLHRYLKQADIPEELKSALGLSYFVSEQISKGTHKFQGYAVDESS
jgi:hypothetical protein